MQQDRGELNARLDESRTEQYCALAAKDQKLLERAVESLHLSARSLHRILHVARTIADLDGATAIAGAHLAEAIGYRLLDRGGGAR